MENKIDEVVLCKLGNCLHGWHGILEDTHITIAGDGGGPLPVPGQRWSVEVVCITVSVRFTSHNVVEFFLRSDASGSGIVEPSSTWKVGSHASLEPRCAAVVVIDADAGVHRRKGGVPAEGQLRWRSSIGHMELCRRAVSCASVRSGQLTCAALGATGRTEVLL